MRKLLSNSNHSLMYGCGGEVEGDIPRVESIVYITFLFSQLFISAFGNTLVCVAILRFRHLKTLTNTFIFSLAITDILTPLVRLLYIAIAILRNKWVFGCFWCKMSSMLGVFLCAASILHLCAISVERFVVIRWPLRHTQLITKKRVVIAVIGIWITALLLSLFPYFDFVEMSFNNHLLDCEIDWQHKPYLSVLLLIFFFMAPFLTMTGTYYFIFKEVHKQTRRISTITGSRRRNDSKMSRFRKHSTIRQEFKAVKTVIVVIGVFFVLWLPFFITTSVRAYLPTSVPPSWQRVVLGLAYLNSSCNWVIYSVMNRQIREAFKRLLFTCNHSESDSFKFESTSRRFSNTGAFVMQYFQRNSGIKHKNMKRKPGILSPNMAPTIPRNIHIEAVDEEENNCNSHATTQTTLTSPTQMNNSDADVASESSPDIDVNSGQDKENQDEVNKNLNATLDREEHADDTENCKDDEHNVAYDSDINSNITNLHKEGGNHADGGKEHFVQDESNQKAIKTLKFPEMETPHIIANSNELSKSISDCECLHSPKNSVLEAHIHDKIVL